MSQRITLYPCVQTSTNLTFISIQYTEKKDVEDIQYINFLLMARAGLRALEYYDPATQKHGQAHMQARYVFRSSRSLTATYCNDPIMNEDWASRNT